MENFIRLSKLLSEKGICSRREADDYIQKGWVFADGECITVLGTKVSKEAKVELKKEGFEAQKSKITLLLNKPLGYLSTIGEEQYPSALELIKEETHLKEPHEKPFSFSFLEKLSFAGRLDVNSKGLLVLTQCGAIAKQLIGEDSEVEKEYFVRIKGVLSHQKCSLLEYGLALDGETLKKAIVKKLSDTTFKIILKEGKKRQIRRMCELLGLDVCELKRVRIGKIEIGTLPLGKWRYLKPSETFI
jgi:23S rRNA pseudouridine2604 synthase